MPDGSRTEVIWEAQPKQQEFLAASEFEVLFGGAAGGGKGQPLNAKVLTPFGYRAMADIQVGSLVCAPDGSVSTVIAVYPLGERQLYRVTFLDGTSTEVTDDHIWLAWKNGGCTKKNGERKSGQDGARLWLTSQMIQSRARLAIPTADPVTFTDCSRYERRPVDPYTLGALIGDGSLQASGLRISSADPEIPAQIPYVLKGPYGNKGVAKEWVCRDKEVIRHLRKWKLLDTTSHTKFIPEAYLLGSVEQRQELLRGLMDTDGWADQDGDIYYCTVSQRLRDDVATLARSLGAYVTIREKMARSQTGSGSLAYTLRIKLREPESAFSLPRKKDRCIGKRPQSMGRGIKSIEPTRIAAAQCIKVSHPSGLYLTNDFIVTHNSDAILIDSLGLQARTFEQKDYQAIIFRRTFPDLKDLIDRSEVLFKGIEPGAEYNKSEHVWRFPSGARIELGYLQYEQDRLKYRGRAFQYLGFEELSLWPTPAPYEYLISRVRSVNPGVKCYVRANTNPDGPGLKWVKERWRIPAEGTATRFPVEITDPDTGAVTVRHRRFIPSRLSDNKYLAGSGYRETLLSLPDDERNALLFGKWSGVSVKGAYYAELMIQARADNRITRVRHDPRLQVNTYWDLGVDDTMVCLMHQRLGQEHRFIDEIAGSGYGIGHYIAEMDKRAYNWGTHWLPHDAEARSVQTGKSTIDICKEMKPGWTWKVVPRVDRIQVGIDMTRQRLPLAWIDTDHCPDLIAALENYRKKWNENAQTWDHEPYHDWSSHHADAFRQWAQSTDDDHMIETGVKRIKARGARSSWRT